MNGSTPHAVKCQQQRSPLDKFKPGAIEHIIIYSPGAFDIYIFCFGGVVDVISAKQCGHVVVQSVPLMSVHPCI